MGFKGLHMVCMCVVTDSAVCVESILGMLVSANPAVSEGFKKNSQQQTGIQL